MLKVSPALPAPGRIKFCTNCKHARVRMTPSNNEIQCGLYYNIDLVTGEKTYESAHAVRHDPQKCGLHAVHFEGLTRSDNL